MGADFAKRRPFPLRRPATISGWRLRWPFGIRDQLGGGFCRRYRAAGGSPRTDRTGQRIAVLPTSTISPPSRWKQPLRRQRWLDRQKCFGVKFRFRLRFTLFRRSISWAGFRVKLIGVMLLFALGMAVGCSSKKAEAPAGSITIKGAGSLLSDRCFASGLKNTTRNIPTWSWTTISLAAARARSGSGGRRRFRGQRCRPHRRGDDLRQTRGGPDSCDRRQHCPGLQPRGAAAAVETLPLGLRRYFPRQDHALERRRIAAINPGVTFPDRDIQVVARQDGSGTTFALRTTFPPSARSGGRGREHTKSPSWPASVACQRK